MVEDDDGVYVVICFHFSIFEPLETTVIDKVYIPERCDLLSF